MSETSNSPKDYPRKAVISIALELDITNKEQDEYIFASLDESKTLQIGFLADLFDILELETDLQVKKINSFTREAITKVLTTALKG